MPKYLGVLVLALANLVVFAGPNPVSAGVGGSFCGGQTPLEDCKCSELDPSESSQCLNVAFHSPLFGEYCGGERPTPQFFCMGGET
jgi:hypothetical protein